MTALGESLIRFFRAWSDVTEVRDASVSSPAGRTIEECIECRYRGADYRVTVAQRYPR